MSELRTTTLCTPAVPLKAVLVCAWREDGENTDIKTCREFYDVVAIIHRSNEKDGLDQLVVSDGFLIGARELAGYYDCADSRVYVGTPTETELAAFEALLKERFYTREEVMAAAAKAIATKETP